jgi:glycine/D-amino acid oxidase-like deaminating enzyme
MRIAVIGAGIFGSVTSYFLANKGHDVTLYEKNSHILNGASFNNQNRLHLGFHYPRDLETAIQSVQGYKEFVEHFSAACEFTFPCFYGLSNINSKSSFESYELFMKHANLKYNLVPTKAIGDYGFNTSNISHLWKCEEGVVDNEILRKLLMENLQRNRVSISLGNQVTEIWKEQDCWYVKSKQHSKNFDIVIKATYGLDNIRGESLDENVSKSMLQATLVIECELPVKKFGLTVVDGDFITVLPKGFSGKFLIYAPGPSVMKQSMIIDEVFKASVSKKVIKKSTYELLERFRFYFPSIELNSITNKLITLRNLEANTMKTDKRISKIEVIAPNYYNVRSGKIDHSILIAKEFCNYLS